MTEGVVNLFINDKPMQLKEYTFYFKNLKFIIYTIPTLHKIYLIFLFLYVHLKVFHLYF
ncbi:hypothetical protein ACTPEM_26660, partial [Clostridioides difficile]